MDEELIYKQEAIDAIRASASKYTGFMEMEMYTDDDAVEAIKALPSVDAEPVRHGRWLHEYLSSTSGGHYAVIRCSNCLWQHLIAETNFCPNCGARMDKEE